MAATITETAQYLTFKLGSELFAINVNNVREVLEITPITQVPTAPEYMRGVVNVRGKPVPVADLRRKFGLEPTPDTVNSRIIVMEISPEGETTVIGGVADSVQAVIELEPSQIEPPPQLAMRWRTELILGLARRGEDFIILLDIEAIFSNDLAAALVAGT